MLSYDQNCGEGILMRFLKSRYLWIGILGGIFLCIAWRVTAVGLVMNLPVEHYHWGLFLIFAGILFSSESVRGFLWGVGVVFIASEFFQHHPFALTKAAEIRNLALLLGFILVSFCVLAFFRFWPRD